MIVVAAVALAMLWVMMRGDALTVAPTIPYAVVGAALAWRRPRSVVGWALVAFAGLWSVAFLSSALADLPSGSPAAVTVAWLAEWTWFPALIVMFVILPIVYPTGAPHGPRWGWVLGFAFALIAFFVVLTTFQQRFETGSGMAVDNPLAVLPFEDAETLLVPLMLPMFLVGPVAIFSRYRQASVLERRQIRWLGYSAVVGTALFLANALLEPSPGSTWGTAASGALLIALSLPPVAIWIAITRHQLYDIDRLVSRTFSYALVVATLAVVYVGVITLLTRVFPFESDLAVAMSTLAAAGLFSPVRHRVLAVVDRRFHRTRFDARKAIEVFSQGLRERTELDDLSSRVIQLVQRILEPETVGVWVATKDDREPGASRNVFGTVEG